MYNQFVQISLVPRQKRLAAQRRVATEGITAVGLSNDSFRVKASGARFNVLDRRASEGIDFYDVRTYESDGEVFATCSCPFGTDGDVEHNVCKHIESALAVRKPGVPIRIEPQFQNGKIVIDIQRNEMTVNITKTNTFGAVETYTPVRKRISPASGETVIRQFQSYISRMF